MAEAESQLSLKNIYSLLGEKFFIPSYQRGYRWTEIEVRALLNDIYEYSRSENASAFYCLQPIIVSKDLAYQEGIRWRVIDGQQRLTTLYILLYYLERKHLRRSLFEAYHHPIYSVEYETRRESSQFLENLENHTQEDVTSMDFEHMSRAYQAVCQWFDESSLDYSESNKLLEVLLVKPDVNRPTIKVIWYDLSDEIARGQSEIDVFTRINIGKIPLTNSELIKALFLQRKNFVKENASLQQLKISAEWDEIEQRLNDPAFWYFIYSDSQKRYSTRIEYIFDLMMKKEIEKEKSSLRKDDPLYTFIQFNRQFEHEKSSDNVQHIERQWKSVKAYFLIFEEWFNDRELYHLIGYLIEVGESIEGLKQAEIAQKTKSGFKLFLKQKVQKMLQIAFQKANIFHINELNYNDNGVLIRQVLLLFNIVTLLRSKESDARFPFYRYKLEKWDLEHIRSVTNRSFNDKEKREWLEEVKEYLQSGQDYPTLVKEIEALLSLSQQVIKEDSFNQLYQSICYEFDAKDEDWIDSIGNLTLLDAATNRSYQNAIFPIKRLRIIENDKQGLFLPIGTKNVFLKYYTSHRNSLNLMSWRTEDVRDYLAEMEAVLMDFLPVLEKK